MLGVLRERKRFVVGAGRDSTKTTFPAARGGSRRAVTEARLAFRCDVDVEGRFEDRYGGLGAACDGSEDFASWRSRRTTGAAGFALRSRGGSPAGCDEFLPIGVTEGAASAGDAGARVTGDDTVAARGAIGTGDTCVAAGGRSFASADLADAVHAADAGGWICVASGGEVAGESATSIVASATATPVTGNARFHAMVAARPDRSGPGSGRWSVCGATSDATEPSSSERNARSNVSPH